MTLSDRFRGVRLEAFYRLNGKRRYSYYRQLVRNESRSRQEIDQTAWMRLGEIVTHAYHTVPYYRRLLDGLGLSPSDIRSYGDFERLPVLTKQQVREHSRDLLSSAAVAGSYHPHSSGGSTGEPVDFYRSWEYEEYSNFAGAYRSAHRAGWQPGEKMAWIWGRPVPPDNELPRSFSGRLRRRVGDWIRDSGALMFDAFNADPDRMESWLPRLRRERPRYLYGYASALRHFTVFLQSRQERLEGILGVISTAETLHPEDRRLFERVYGAVVIDQYGSREVCSIATSCARGVLHVNSDLVRLEYGDLPDQAPLKRLIVTDLHNTVFPFLRYEIGDCGQVGVTECSCGLPFPALQMSIGRTFDNFVSPEGRIVHGAFFKNLMDGVPGIQQFQFRQVLPARVVLSVVKSNQFGPATESYLQQLRARLAREFSEHVELEVRIVDRIQALNSGKYRYTICELNQELQPAQVRGDASQSAPSRRKAGSQ